MRFKVIVWLFTIGDFEPQVPSGRSVSHALNGPPDSSSLSFAGGLSLMEEKYITEQDKWPQDWPWTNPAKWYRPKRLKNDTC